MVKIFIPIYNEGDRIVDNLREIRARLKEYFNQFQIYVINDGSTDDTAANLLPTIGLFDFYYYYSGPSRRENLALAMRAYGAPGDIIIMLDADRSTNESVIPDAVYAIENSGYDIVIGNRYDGRSIIKRSLKRLVISKIYNFMIRLFFETIIDDHECGFKVFRYEKLVEILKDMPYNLNRKFFWDAEVIIRAINKRFKICEIPVTWTEGRRSSQSFWKDKAMIWYIIKKIHRL
jgi:glycosyltransferase involved in cell wall biosynthesis